MKTSPRSLLFAAFAVSGFHAFADDVSASTPLVQTRFDKLIPSSFPVVQTSSSRLHQTTFQRLTPFEPSARTNFDRLQQTAYDRMVSTSSSMDKPVRVIPGTRQNSPARAARPVASQRPSME